MVTYALVPDDEEIAFAVGARMGVGGERLNISPKEIPPYDISDEEQLGCGPAAAPNFADPRAG